MPSGDNLLINNESGNFRFTGNANLDSNAEKINLNSKSIFKVNASGDISINTDTGNTKLIKDTGKAYGMLAGAYDVIPVNFWFQGLIPGYFQNTPHPTPDRDFGKSTSLFKIFFCRPSGGENLYF